MLLSESSVKDLSSKLEKDVTVERFRPNIVISDCQPFEEVCCLAHLENLQKSTQTKTNTPERDVTIRLEPQMLLKENRSSISPHCSP